MLSLRGGLSFAAYVRRETARPLPDFTPFASVIAPCRGQEDGLRDNLAALLKLNYPNYEVIFVTDREDDPALKVVEEITRSENNSERIVLRVLIAGEAVDCGQKVHNLRVAVSGIDRRSTLHDNSHSI